MRFITLLLASCVLLACGSGAASAPTPMPSATPAPAASPVPPTTTPEPLTGAALYEQVARDAARPLDTRAAVGLPSGSWEVLTLLPGEVIVTYPMTAGMSTEQTIRQGQRQIAAMLAALFDSDPALNLISITGTLPNTTGDELPAVSAFVSREDFATWNGNPADLPNLRIAESLQP